MSRQEGIRSPPVLTQSQAPLFLWVETKQLLILTVVLLHALTNPALGTGVEGKVRVKTNARS